MKQDTLRSGCCGATMMGRRLRTSGARINRNQRQDNIGGLTRRVRLTTQERLGHGGNVEDKKPSIQTTSPVPGNTWVCELRAVPKVREGGIQGVRALQRRGKRGLGRPQLLRLRELQLQGAGGKDRGSIGDNAAQHWR